MSQLHRSPGICFETSVHLNGKLLHGFRIIPDRGSWMKCNSTRAICSTFIWIGASAAANFWRRPSFGRSVILPTRTSSSCFYEVIELDLSENLDEEEISTKVLFEDIRDGEITVARF